MRALSNHQVFLYDLCVRVIVICVEKPISWMSVPGCSFATR